MPSRVPDFATLERRLAGLPVVKHPAREVVLTAGSKTGKVLFLKSGTVEVVKDGVQIASVNAPGSVFGEQALLLGPAPYGRREDSGGIRVLCRRRVGDSCWRCNHSPLRRRDTCATPRHRESMACRG